MTVIVGPFDHLIAVTPADADLPAGACAALLVLGGGDVLVVDHAGAQAWFRNVPSGRLLPVQALRVRAATTASSIFAGYYV